MICNVIYDGYYNAVSATPEYFEFIGAKNISSFIKNVYESDVQQIKSAFEKLKLNEKVYLIAGLKKYNGEYEKVFIEAKLIKDGTPDAKRIYTDIYSIEFLKSAITKKNLSISTYRMLLDIVGQIYFEYLIDEHIIRFYWINKNQDVDIYNGSFDEWKDYMLSKKYIKNKNISTFEKLCKDIENGTKKFVYEITDSKIYADAENVYNVFKGCTIYFEEKPYKVIGTLVSINNKNEKEFAKVERDSLTGLLNKESIVKYATELINKKPDFSVNVVIIDIDNFKLINDNFGHLFGDEIIKSIADTIEEIVKERGVIGRFGGDEFVVIFSGFNDNMEMRSYLRAIRMTIERKFKNIKNKIDLTVSIGTSKYPINGQTYDELFEIADSALYIAKEKGKNRYVIYDEVVDVAFYEKKDKKNSVAIESREKIAKFMCNNVNILMEKNKDGIYDVISNIGNKSDLSRVAVFYGKNLERVALWGDEKGVYDNAQYIYKGNYLTNFNSNGVFVVHSSSSIEVKNPDVHSDFSNQTIFSTIQCLIYNDLSEIVGMVSFEKSFQRKGWTEKEVYNFTIIAYMIGEVLKR